MSSASPSLRDELREATLPTSEEEVLALTVTNDYVLWVSMTGVLYAWDRRTIVHDGGNSTVEQEEEEECGPQRLATLGFSPPPHLLTATEDGEVYVSNGAHLGLYVLEREARSVTRPLSSSLPCRDGVGGAMNGGYVTSVLVEDLVLREIVVVTCHVRAASHLSVSSDGSTAALASPNELVLVNIRELANSEANARCEHDAVADPFGFSAAGWSKSAAAEYVANASILRVDCSDWFGKSTTDTGAEAAGGGAGATIGCARTCFVTATHLIVLSTGNHLVSVNVDWTQQAVWLARDGHVLTRKHGILALAARDDLVAMGLTDGTVKLLQSSTLAVFKTLDIVASVERIAAAELENANKELYTVKPWLRPSAGAGAGGGGSTARRGGDPPQGTAVKGRKSHPGAGGGSPSPPTTYGNVDSCSSARRSDSSSPEPNGQVPSVSPLIVDLAIGASSLLIASPEVMVRVPRDTLTVEEQHVFFLHQNSTDGGASIPPAVASKKSTDDLLIACASEGSWAAWSALDANLQYYVAAPSGGFAGGAGGYSMNPDDIIHAQAPLPSKWLMAAAKVRNESLICGPQGASSSTANSSSYNSTLARKKAQVSNRTGKPPPTSLQSGSPPPARSHQRQQQGEGRESKSKESPSSAPNSMSRPQMTVDKPVTFGRAIKSSGYGASEPWSVQQDRKKAAKQRAKRQAAIAVGVIRDGGGPLSYKGVDCPYEAHRFTAMASTNRLLANEVGVHSSIVMSCTFTASGDGLVSTSGNGGYYLKLPVSNFKGDGSAMLPSSMHDGAVAHSRSSSLFLCSAANLSLNAPIVATGSAEGVIHFWKPSCSYKAHKIMAGRRTSSLGAGLYTGEAPVITHQLLDKKEVRSVRFFYMDKFLAYTAGASIHFSPYSVDERRRGGGGGGGGAVTGVHASSGSAAAAASLESDLNRLRNDSYLAAPVFTFKAGGQHITSMDCANHFASSLVVLAGSNKAITVLDVNHESPLRTITEAHRRAIHKVSLFATGSSRFADESPTAAGLATQHLFASAGLDGAATVWDLRQDKAVRQYTLHKNASLSTIALAFNPTGDLLAVGSEDRTLHLYDARRGNTTLDVIKCSSVPTSVAFHPVDPVMAVGLSTGELLCYSQN